MTLETPVPLFQHELELEALLHIYRQTAPRRVLEIGTYHGGTLYHWIREATVGTLIVSIDSYSEGVDNRDLFRTWPDKAVRLITIKGDSRDPEVIAQAKTTGPYDWLFIDAGHYYAEVKADWENYRPLVTPGGIVAFHDILTHPAHPEIEVERLWRELQTDGYRTREIVADPNADWGGIGVVFLP